MTPKKVLEVIDRYDDLFKVMQITPQKLPETEMVNPDDGPSCLSHCAAMLPEMRDFVEERRMDKVFRWLGFIQGVLWRGGILPLQDLKNHSRPDQEEGPA